MKSASEIWAAWTSGEFMGINKAHARVTVEPEWELETTDLAASQNGWPGDTPGPWRYFQSTSGSLNTEVEVPNIKSIQIDRSIDTDAASCTITIYNQWMDNNTSPSALPDQLGNPGYFTFNRGDSEEAQGRWNHQQNEWNNILMPMALIRTYEGWGGYTEVNGGTVPLSIGDALTGGYIVKTGTWIVDRVSIGANGLITLSCRDAGKLLIEQFVIPPLIPQSVSPLKYYRWRDDTYNSVWNPGGALAPQNDARVAFSYANSSSDILLGAFNSSVLGQYPAQACDNNASSYALGFGYDTADGPECVEWWEFAVNSNIDKVYINPYGGPYTVYVSVMENGVWQGTGNIPFTQTSFTDPVIGFSEGAIEADIPYLVVSGVTYNTPVTIGLPRSYNAQRVRVSFRGLMQTLLDYRPYRAGLYEVYGLLSSTVATTTRTAYALARHYSNGYWAIGENGQQFYFGEARELTKNDTVGISARIIAAEGHPTDAGFWTLEENGRVHAYGASTFLGDASATGATDFIDMAVTHTGNGYWLLRRSGGVYTYGDAEYMAGTYQGLSYTGELPTALVPQFTATAIAGHPTSMGYWITDSKGLIGNFGAASNVGQVSAPFPATGTPAAIEPTPTGNGYWILWQNGQIFNYGDATNVGQATGGSYSPTGTQVYVDLVRTNYPITGFTQGYWAMRSDATIVPLGAQYFGQPGSNDATIRSDGNYLDYLDIVKDLLGWCGFSLSEFSLGIGTRVAGIHGILESTGIYSDEPLAEDIFDKKPIMDAIRTIAEIVGYVTWVDEDGGFNFRSPNWWGPGNYYDDGSRVTMIPEVDEELQLFDYSITFEDAPLRSEIIIANQMPTEDNTSTITTRYTPPGQSILRGMVRPAIWANEVFNNPSEQQIMAELIAMHIWFSQRQGNVTCIANPCIQINDQVRIWERVTGESYIHFVRGVSTSHDLDSGEYTMTLTTHWLGSETSWVIQPSTSLGTGQIETSAALDAYLATSRIQQVLKTA